MSLSTWYAFVIASWLICLAPGPGALSSVTAGLRHGARGALWNLVGLQAGGMLTLAIVGAGVGALLAASPSAFTAVKWFGAAYLLYLGIQQWRAPALAVDSTATPDRAAAGALVLRGFLVNVSNPKGILFMLAVLPQFIDPQAPKLPQYLIVAATLLVTDCVCMSGYAALGVRALGALRSPTVMRASNRLFGTLFVAAAVGLAVFERG